MKKNIYKNYKLSSKTEQNILNQTINKQKGNSILNLRTFGLCAIVIALVFSIYFFVNQQTRPNYIKHTPGTLEIEGYNYDEHVLSIDSTFIISNKTNSYHDDFFPMSDIYNINHKPSQYNSYINTMNKINVYKKTLLTRPEMYQKLVDFIESTKLITDVDDCLKKQLCEMEFIPGTRGDPTFNGVNNYHVLFITSEKLFAEIVEDGGMFIRNDMNAVNSEESILRLRKTWVDKYIDLDNLTVGTEIPTWTYCFESLVDSYLRRKEDSLENITINRIEYTMSDDNLIIRIPATMEYVSTYELKSLEQAKNELYSSLVLNSTAINHAKDNNYDIANYPIFDVELTYHNEPYLEYTIPVYRFYLKIGNPEFDLLCEEKTYFTDDDYINAAYFDVLAISNDYINITK